jgi:hypothetical protein
MQDERIMSVTGDVSDLKFFRPAGRASANHL